MATDFKYSFTIRNRTIKFREWKVKDKKLIDEAKTIRETRQAIVYNCLENPDTPLDMNEFQYALFCIRNASLQDYVATYTFRCSKCFKEYDCEADMSQIIKPKYKDYFPIESENFTLEFCDIKNKDYYEDIICGTENLKERELFNFILHLSKVNGQVDFNFNGMLETINDMNVGEFEYIFRQWDSMKFRLDNVSTVKCPYCGNEEQMAFDTIPDFFPVSWTSPKL